MKSLVVASMERSAGKTSLIAGLGRSLRPGWSYMKPYGDRMVYLKKRLWDYDAAVMTQMFSLQSNPEDMTMGFGHSKLRYMYDAETRRARLRGMVERVGRGAELLVVEGGAGLRHGGSVGLDPVTVARELKARLVVVSGGDEDVVLDDLHFLKKDIDLKGVDFGGVVVNKVPSVQSFRESCLGEIEGLGIPILGIMPFEKELTYPSVGFLAEKLFAKAVTGVAGMDRVVRNIFVGAMSADPDHKNTLANIINKEHKLIITSGDRIDMILTALESDTSCILLTNNILPPSNIISKARDLGVPLLLVTQDTYSVATQINELEPMLTKHDAPKAALVERLVKDNVDLGAPLRF
jgi:BioD-like phosphotransacetylase family protein